MEEAKKVGYVPKSLGFVVRNVGDASVINIKNPSIHAVRGKLNLRGIDEDVFDDEV